jgi:ribosomal-protein-serine acetyltransferase
MNPIYTDGTYSIRPYEPEDIDRLYDAVRESLDVLIPWMQWCHPEYSRSESEAWVISRVQAWRENDEYSFVIQDISTGRLLGTVGLHKINRMHNFTELGYWVRKNAMGKGTATAAAILAARFGFQELGLNRIEILVAVGNRASQRVAEKSGARKEGILRNRLMIRDAVHDAVLYSFIRNDMSA